MTGQGQAPRATASTTSHLVEVAIGVVSGRPPAGLDVVGTPGHLTPTFPPRPDRGPPARSLTVRS